MPEPFTILGAVAAEVADVAEREQPEQPSDCFVTCPRCHGASVVPLAETDEETDSQRARVARVRAQLEREHEARMGPLRVDRKPAKS